MSRHPAGQDACRATGAGAQSIVPLHSGCRCRITRCVYFHMQADQSDSSWECLPGWSARAPNESTPSPRIRDLSSPPQVRWLDHCCCLYTATIKLKYFFCPAYEADLQNFKKENREQVTAVFVVFTKPECAGTKTDVHVTGARWLPPPFAWGCPRSNRVNDGGCHHFTSSLRSHFCAHGAHSLLWLQPVLLPMKTQHPLVSLVVVIRIIASADFHNAGCSIHDDTVEQLQEKTLFLRPVFEYCAPKLTEMLAEMLTMTQSARAKGAFRALNNL